MQQIQNKTILVTGGAGFIGSNLCERLLRDGNKVVCLDNFATGRRSNIAPLLRDANFMLIEGDTRNIADCHLAAQGVDYILHQAALGSIPRSMEDPLTVHAVNVTGFLNMLVAARDAKVKKMVYATSSSVYGSSTALPKVEDEIGDALSPYAVGKHMNELYAGVFHRCYGLNTIGLRYFNVFGRHQDPKGAYAAAIPKFVRQLMSYESPTINGDGSHSRDFTYIENVIQMNILALATENPDAMSQVYNTACGRRANLEGLIATLKKHLVLLDPSIGQVPVHYGKALPADIPHSLACINKAKELLGYIPTYAMEEGLALAVPWYWEHYRSETALINDFSSVTLGAAD